MEALSAGKFGDLAPSLQSPQNVRVSEQPRTYPMKLTRKREEEIVERVDQKVLSPVRNDRNSADSVDEPLAGMRYALYNSF
jgi:hypothetical protein